MTFLRSILTKLALAWLARQPCWSGDPCSASERKVNEWCMTCQARAAA